jgi:PRTRC genetic system protein B
MTTVHDQTASTWLTSAVLVYSSPHDGKAFATIHPIKDGGSRPQIGPGRAMTEGDFHELVAALKPAARREITGSDWISDKLLSRAMGRLTWWTPPSYKPMFFDGGHVKGQAIVPLPALVFSAGNTGLRVRAIAGGQRPRPETPTAYAPFFNVSAAGVVCLGTTLRPEENLGDEEVMAHWETAFFQSRFTHPSTGMEKRMIAGQLATAFWADALRDPPTQWRDEWLVPTNEKTVDLIGGGSHD